MTGDPPRVTVLVADSHPLYLTSLEQLVRQAPDLSLIAAGETGREALALIQEHHPQVAVLDLRLRGLDAREIVRTLRATELPTRVLLLSEHGTGEIVLQCLTAGAAGFMSKYATADDIHDAVVAVSRGESVLPPDVGRVVAGALRSHPDDRHQDLTDREMEILQMLPQGESASSIAVRLDVSTATVKTHIQHIYAKLGVSDRGAAVATAMRRGLIE